MDDVSRRLVDGTAILRPEEMLWCALDRPLHSQNNILKDRILKTR